MRSKCEVSTEEEVAFYREWISRAADVCQRAADGDLEHRILLAPEDGELARMLGAINHLLDMTDAYVRESGASLDYAARGRFFRRVVPRGMRGSFLRAAGIINCATGEMANQAAALQASEKQRQEMGEELSQVVGTLASSATEMRATAETLAAVASETTDHAMLAASAAESTSTNMALVAEEARNLRAESGGVDLKARESVMLTREAAKQALETGPVVENLAVVSRRACGVVKLVSDIARQSNMLALNATIEAARAGDAGRGFAVVAHEVKDLAQRTASATEEIGMELKRMEDASVLVGDALGQICRRIEGVDRISGVIADSVARQRESADQIVANVDRAAASAQDVSKGIQLVSKATQETDSCSSQLVGAADDLSRQSERLRTGSEQYLHGTPGR